MANLAFYAYTVVDFEQKGKRRSKWLKVGTAFEHKDGEGLDILFDAFPVNGRVSLRKPKSKEALDAAKDEVSEASGTKA